MVKVIHRGCPSRGPRDHRGIGRRGGNFAAQQLLKRPTSKNWRAKLLSVLRARLTLENWRAKLMSVLLATMLWYLIKKNVATTSSPSERSSPARVTETR